MLLQVFVFTYTIPGKKETAIVLYKLYTVRVLLFPFKASNKNNRYLYSVITVHMNELDIFNSSKLRYIKYMNMQCNNIIYYLYEYYPLF